MSILVLVVDDEPDIEALFRQQFRRDLRAERFIMDFAGSAPDALARVGDTREHSLILILSDINMPGMTGLEMLPKVKEMRPDVPVIMITAYATVENAVEAFQRGAHDYLMKPILLDEVLSGLNPAEIASAVRLIQRIRAQGTSILFVEHLMRAVLELSDRVVVLNEGEVIAAGAPRDVMRDPHVVQVYLGRAHVVA